MIILAVIKHIKSHNANYSDTMEYLLFQHDEKTGKMLQNELGQKILRDEFYLDGLNCNPDTFDIECRMTNEAFKKNRRRNELKSHHYIISFDPADVSECGLTGKRAQELCLEFAKKNFPGYQAVVVTHTDGGNHSGNIHTHIVINSVRKNAVARQNYMDKPNEEKAGYKHRSTNRFLEHLKREVMAMCEREGLHQIDLLSPAPEKVTEAEFRAKIRGQKKLAQINQEIVRKGLKPVSTTFQTQKDFLRKAIDECSGSARNFKEFQSLLLEKNNISVILHRGRYRYLHPDRNRGITEKALGTDYGMEHMEKRFLQNENGIQPEHRTATHHSVQGDYHKDPTAELNLKQITDKLNSEFASDVRKLVFWYDANAEFREDIDSIELENAKVLHLEPDNQFYIKYFLEREDTTTNYLVYAPFAKPGIKRMFRLRFNFKNKKYDKSQKYYLVAYDDSITKAHKIAS